MKKDTLIRVVVMVVALLAASYLANILTPMQKEISIEKGELTKAPIAGLHKIMADVAWMRFINVAGGMDTIDTKNVDKIIISDQCNRRNYCNTLLPKKCAVSQTVQILTGVIL